VVEGAAAAVDEEEEEEEEEEGASVGCRGWSLQQLWAAASGNRLERLRC
jgi:hypothetical protein